jgi:uncharacterized protein (TIGR04255 family)
LESEYPRFETLAPQFTSYYTRWAEHIDRAGLGTLAIKGAELTYVNQIYSGEGWTDLQSLHNVIPGFKAVVGDGPKPNIVDGALTSVRHTGSCVVRTDAKLARLVANPDRLLAQLEIKAQAAVPVTSFGDLTGWLADANEQIVETFIAVTDPTAQKEVWQRVGA